MGFNFHHGLMDVWAQANYPFIYNRDTAPTIVINAADHVRANGVQNRLLAQLRRIYGANPANSRQVAWTNVPLQAMIDVADRMFDAMHVPQQARLTYFRAFNLYMSPFPGSRQMPDAWQTWAPYQQYQN
jgi:hypothetical protein